MHADQKILDRIRRLLAMAKDSSSPNEAAIAARRAQKLMEEYNIENVESIVTDLETDLNLGMESVTEFKVAEGRRAKEVPSWTSQLAVAVARLFDCEVKIGRDDWGNAAIQFYGYKTDLAVAKWTFEFLLEQIRRFNNEARKQYKGNRALLQDYRLGMIAGVYQVVKEAIAAKQAAYTPVGTSLVVVKKDAIVKKFGDFRYRKAGTTKVDAFAYTRGVADGRSVQLNRPLTGSNPTRRIR